MSAATRHTLLVALLLGFFTVLSVLFIEIGKDVQPALAASAPALQIQGISIDSGDFSRSSDCAFYPPMPLGKSCHISVTFRPTQAGTRTGTLTINFDQSGSPFTVALKGTGVDSSTVATPSGGSTSSSGTSNTGSNGSGSSTNTGSSGSSSSGGSSGTSGSGSVSGGSASSGSSGSVPSTPGVIRIEGSSATYARMQDAAAAAKDGDIIDVGAGTYTNAAAEAVFTQNNLTIKGVGGRPIMAMVNGYEPLLQGGKGIWIMSGDHQTVDNIEFTGAHVGDLNGAGVRDQGSNLTVRNSYFHHNENGILAVDAGNLLIEYNEFYHNGQCPPNVGCSHNVYVGHGPSLTFRYNYSHGATIGHELKTRAEVNYILYNRITDEDGGTASYDIDVPNGGETYIIGNLIEKDVNADNDTAIAYGEEGAVNPTKQLYIVNNTLVNKDPAGRFLNVSGAPTGKVMNNLIVGMTNMGSGGGLPLSNNVVTQTPGLFDQNGYDYRLVAGSPAIDAGADPGSSANGFSLAPDKVYIHPMQYAARKTSGAAIDAGAYEYDPGIAVPPALTFAAQQSVVAPGAAASLTWAATYANSCTASGSWSGSKSLSGSFTTSAITTPQTFTLVCSSAAGTVTKSVTVSSAASSLSLNITPSTVVAGTSATLSWSGTNISSCTASGDWSGSQAGSGSYNTGPISSAKAYTLTCTGTAGSITKTVSVTTTAAPNNPIASLAPGTWYEVPDSHLQDHALIPGPYVQNGYANEINEAGWFSSIMSAWNGGAFDTKRDRLIVTGGGHDGWPGNELYAFDLNTLKWSAITTPSQFPSGLWNNAPTMPDGTPTTRHGYGGLNYIPSTDTLFLGGAYGFVNGGAAPLFTFDFASGKWTEVQPALSNTLISAYDPVTNKVYAYRLYGTLYSYDPTTGTTKDISGLSIDYYAQAHVAAIDPGRRLMVIIGTEDHGNAEVYAYHLDTGVLEKKTTAGPVDEVLASVGGPTGTPGLEYDPKIDRFVTWRGGSDIYVLNDATWTWTKIPAAAGNTIIPPSDVGRGTFGRFRYSPNKDVFVVANQTGQDVYLYKLDASKVAAAEDAQRLAAAPQSQLLASLGSVDLSVLSSLWSKVANFLPVAHASTPVFTLDFGNQQVFRTSGAKTITLTYGTDGKVTITADSGTSASPSGGSVGSGTEGNLNSNDNGATPPSAALLRLTRSLYRGLRGDDITSLQNFLMSQGFLGAGNNTGYFGPLTAAGVQKYQCQANIVCTGSESATGWGVVGPKTLKSLTGQAYVPSSSGSAQTAAPSISAPVSSGPTLQSGDQSDQVRLLQAALARLGYLTADQETGYFGDATLSAVARFQCDHQIICYGNPVSTGYGLVGPHTRAVLGI